MWLKYARAQGIPIFGSILQEKEQKLAKRLGIDDFHITDSWLHGFKRRFDIYRWILGRHNWAN